MTVKSSYIDVNINVKIERKFSKFYLDKFVKMNCINSDAVNSGSFVIDLLNVSFWTINQI